MRIIKLSLLGFAVFMFFSGISLTWAAAPNVSLFMKTWLRFNVNDLPQTLEPLQVTDNEGGGITSANGVTIMLPKDMDILWDKSVAELMIDGTSSVSVSYDKALKNLNVPVSKTFAAGESITITGAKVRIYYRGYSYQDLKLDVTGDGVSDATGVNGIQLDATSPATDFLKPYPISSLSSKLEGKTITLSWENPPDPDYVGIVATRVINRSGQKITKEFTIGAGLTTYSETDDFQPGDSVEYKFSTKDNVANVGDEVVATTVQIPTVDTVNVETVDLSPGTTTAPIQDTTTTGTSTLDSVLQSDIDAALVKYADLSADNVAIKELVYLIKIGALKGTRNALKPNQEISNTKFAALVGKAFGVEKTGGGYLSTFKKLKYLSKSAKASTKVTRKNAFKVLLKIKGVKLSEQTIVDYSSLKGRATLTDIAVWILKTL